MPTLNGLTTKSFWGTLRVFGFFAVVSGLSCVLLLNTARAEAEKRTRALGEKLLAQLGPLVLDEPTPFLFNGQQVYFASSLTPLGPQEVLARFEKYCHENSSGLAQAVGKLPSRIRGQKLPEELRDPATWFTVRGDRNDADYGQITCVARSEQTTLARFLFALGIPHVGESTSKALVQWLGTLHFIRHAPSSVLRVLPDVGAEVAA